MTVAIMLSVVTINYNDKGGLWKTADSLVRQTTNEWEWICVDGGSRDGSQEVMHDASEALRKFGVKCNLISEPDHGIYDAMNKGLMRAQGRYVIFLNGGDFLSSSSSLKKINEALYQAEDADLLLCGGYVRYADLIDWYRAPRSLFAVRHGLPALHQSTIYKTTSAQRIQYDVRYKICADYKLAADFFRNKAKAIMLDEAVAIHPIHGGAAISNVSKVFFESYRIQKEVLGLTTFYCFFSGLRRAKSIILSLLLSYSRLAWLGNKLLPRKFQRASSN